MADPVQTPQYMPAASDSRKSGCNSPVPAGKKRKSVHADHRSAKKNTISCQACRKIFESQTCLHELANCGHGFCRPCISHALGVRLLRFFETKSAGRTWSKYESSLWCPVEGCCSLLSRQDLHTVLGRSTLALLDEWVMKALINQVIFPLLWRCPICKDPDNQLLIPASRLDQLTPEILCKAITCNGLTNPCTGKNGADKRKLVKYLKGVAPVSLLCFRCFLMVCPSCGMKLAPGTGVVHQCDAFQRQCFDMTRSLMKLCSAYMQETHVPAQSPKNAQNVKKRCSVLGNDEGSFQMDGNGLSYQWLCRWLNGRDFDVDEDADPRGKKQLDVQGSGVTCPQGRLASGVDAKAQIALEELTSFLMRIAEDKNHTVLSVLAVLLCSNDLAYTLLKWLVRNDSLTDVAARSELYKAVLSFMRVLSSMSDLLPLLCSPGPKHDVIALTQSHCWETSGSVIADFKNLFKQAQFVLCRGKHLLHDEPNLKRGCTIQANDKLRSGFLLSALVEDIVFSHDLLKARIEEWEARKVLPHDRWNEQSHEITMKLREHCLVERRLRAQLEAFINSHRTLSLGPSMATRARTRAGQVTAEPGFCKYGEESSTRKDCGEATNGEQSSTSKDSMDTSSKFPHSSVPSAALVQAYKDALRPLQFEESCLLPTHYFRFWVQDRVAHKLINIKRARAISEEMTLFNTRLPLEWESSIFLRVDEQRLDVLRALIIGPKDTPYENGIFLFDFLLEESYPDTPPKVQFLTTGGGTVGFNPNLYPNGMLCLSLLGTWSGPGWKPGQSSIMQVLVSIQALILVADPYYNEPYVTKFSSRSSADCYLRDRRLNTLQHSILPALLSPDPLFLQVIHLHFRLKASHIRAQFAAWMSDEERPNVVKEYKPLIDQLHRELDKLTDTTSNL